MQVQSLNEVEDEILHYNLQVIGYVLMLFLIILECLDDLNVPLDVFW